MVSKLVFLQYRYTSTSCAFLLFLIINVCYRQSTVLCDYPRKKKAQLSYYSMFYIYLLLMFLNHMPSMPIFLCGIKNGIKCQYLSKYCIKLPDTGPTEPQFKTDLCSMSYPFSHLVFKVLFCTYIINQRPQN